VSTEVDGFGQDAASPVEEGGGRELSRLESRITKLREQAQTLMSDKVFLENEISSLKRRLSRLDDEVRMLKSPPLVVGQIQDIMEHDRAVVRSSNGTIFVVSLNPHLSINDLRPGTRVSLNQDTLAVMDILESGRDPLVSGAELVERPRYKFTDLGGLDDQIQRLREAIEWPLSRPKDFLDMGIEPPKGVLLVGPPGCGKTMLAQAVAASSDATFIRMVGSELAQKYIGEGGRMVRELFEMARERSPAIVFLDEIDAIGAKRLDSATSGDREVQRTLMQLLSELDGFVRLEGVKIIAATNRPDILDDALLRPGRFDRIIEIPYPDEDGRRAILDIHLSPIRTTRSVDKSWIIKRTEGWSGADLKALCTEAGMEAIRVKAKSVSMKHIRAAQATIEKKREESRRKGSPRHDLWA